MPYSTHSWAQEEGFSLTELLVVLVIVGILALLAIPRFLSITTKAKASEAKANLSHLYTLQQTHYFEHDQYAPDLLTLGFEQPATVDAGGSAYYRYSIEATEAGFAAVATSVVDFDKDGTFNEWAIDEQKRLTERVVD
ncbi:MAG: prepilin-type N-terminal cleavage/methylation domain-containing protein [Bacteroidota bacterium]